MQKNIHPGKFIVFEGLDGSGQSTMALKLRNHIGAKNAILTKEPRPENKLLRRILDKKQKLDAKRIQELFAEDRKSHLKKIIIPNLRKSKNVISDRYLFSSFAFGKANGVGLKYLISLNKNYLKPDIVFFMKALPDTCIKRIKKRGSNRTLFENKKVLNRVYKNFEDLEKRYNFITIDAEKDIKDVFNQILKKLKGSNIKL